jgi:gliding motility-associated-like protein
MKKLLYLFLLPASGVFAQGAAAPPPQVLNSAGTTTVVGGNYYGFNIGEPVTGTGNPTGNYYTQGFLQPDYKIGTAFGASLYFGGESCQNSGDGYIVANPFNNNGPVTLILSPGTTYTTTAITNVSPGTYTLTVQDSAGNYVVKVVTIQASTRECEDTVYHAFSPNGDGLNDLFIISGIERFADNHVYFFNRWGQNVWDAANYDNVKVVWDGKDKQGVALTSGTYYYIIDRKGRKPQKSWVELTR